MKGKLFKLANDFIKLGYTVYGYNNPKFYPFDDSEYNIIIIGKKNNSRIISVSYDALYDLTVSLEFKPHYMYGNSVIIFTEKDSEVNSETILKYAFDLSLYKSVFEKVNQYSDIFEFILQNTNFKLMNLSKPKYRCPVCKGTNVQVLAWVDANTNEFISDYDSECWCGDCEDYTLLEEIE